MITVLLAALRAIIIKLIGALATRKLLEWLLFWTGELIVTSTKTLKDDEFLVELKAAYYSSPETKRAKAPEGKE